MKNCIFRIICSIIVLFIVNSCSVENLESSENNSTLPQAIALTTSSPMFEPFVVVDPNNVQAAIDEINNNGGGSLYFPTGVYEFDGIMAGKTNLQFNALNGFELYGASGAVIRLNDRNGHNLVRTLSIVESQNIYVHNIDFEGNISAYPEIRNQANVFISRSQNINVRNINSTHVAGDGLIVNGGDIGSSDVHISHCYFNKTTRNGITFGNGQTSDIIVTDNIFGGNIRTQQIDFEHGQFETVLITNNRFYLLEESSNAMNQYAIAMFNNTSATITQNDFGLNPLLFRNSQEIIVEHNTAISQLSIDRAVHGIDIAENSFVMLPVIRNGNPNRGGISIREASGVRPSDVSVETNTFDIQKDVTTAVFIQDAMEEIQVSNNKFAFEYFSSDNIGILAHAQNFNMTISECGNSFSNENTQILEQENTGVSLTVNNCN